MKFRNFDYVGEIIKSVQKIRSSWLGLTPLIGETYVCATFPHILHFNSTSFFSNELTDQTAGTERDVVWPKEAPFGGRLF
jgi:hypothetical protein